MDNYSPTDRESDNSDASSNSSNEYDQMDSGEYSHHKTPYKSIFTLTCNNRTDQSLRVRSCSRG